MNYSTLKKTVALSFVSLMAVGMVKAQTSTTTAADTSKMSSGTTTAKVFGGLSQYSTWSVGVNLGVTSPYLITGGVNATNGSWQPAIGYGISLRDKLAHSFSLQLDLHGGTVKGDNTSSVAGTDFGYKSFSTDFLSGSIIGLANVASVDFVRRKNFINFYVSTGIGLASYKPTYTDANGNQSTYTNRVKELLLPVGGLVKFRVTDAIAVNVGYTENFIDGYNFSGYHTYNKAAVFPDHYSYSYAGLEYTFGTKSKPNLDWVNPVAMMYDELYDAALRQEVEALKGRVSNVENAVNDLKKDSDGDGVSDQFDKCPNTPAGTVVDGSGCPVIFPKFSCDSCKTALQPAVAPYTNIQFEFDSSVLKTSSYPVLDATSADLRTTGAPCELDGFASSEGTAAHNMRLSRDRANSVKTYLVNSGVDAKKLKVKAFGETHPIADNSTEAGRILNRRVEFKKR